MHCAQLPVPGPRPGLLRARPPRASC